MGQFTYGSDEPKTITVKSHDGRDIQVPENLKRRYDAAKPETTPAEARAAVKPVEKKGA
ncbi:hypothetical protein [Gulosibacter faecalis]|uniref:Multidrug transporter n=1 Tax=Gulosibacter faecalis TaxID=272240 RepID=A0ABW5UW33_9MICO|nr:hypothetical protein [Gulosibacter faecalis]